MIIHVIDIKLLVESHWILKVAILDFMLAEDINRYLVFVYSLKIIPKNDLTETMEYQGNEALFFGFPPHCELN